MIEKLEVLELKPIKKKKITSILIEVQNWLLNRINTNYLTNILADKNIEFISFDTKIKNLNDFLILLQGRLIAKLKGPYYPLDVPEYAKSSILMEIFKKENQLSELLDEYLRIPNVDSIKGQNLKSWIYLLEDEIRKENEYYFLKLRPQWIGKKILDRLRATKSKEIVFIHLAPREAITEMIQIFKDLNIEVMELKSNKEIIVLDIITTQEGIENWKY